MAALSLLLLLVQAATQPAGDRMATQAGAMEAVAPTAKGTADAVARWHPYTLEASRRFGVPLAWIERVMRAESGGRTTLGGRPIISRADAMGLMQIMPATWAELRARLALGSDPHDPRDNILAGTFYLRLMYDRFGYPGLFGAYNAGSARYAAWLAGRGVLPAETRAYLAQMEGGSAASPRNTPRTGPAPPALFAIRADALALAAPVAERARSDLFVILSGSATATRPPD
jgi:soluble lytic murein transglycosylase-like protein